MREAYKEYIKEHPEELKELNRIKNHSRYVKAEREARKTDAIEILHKWKEALNGNSDI